MLARPAGRDAARDQGAAERPGHAGHGQGGRQADGPGPLPARAPARSSRASTITDTYIRELPARPLGAARPRLRRRDLRRTAEAAPAEGLRRAATRSARRASRRRTTRTCAGRPGSRSCGSTRSGGREASSLEKRRPQSGRLRSGSRSTSSSSRRPSRRSSYGISQAQAERRLGTRTAARSSRSTRATARSSRSPRTRPTSRASTRAASSARRLAQRRASRPDGRGGQLPGARPRDRRRLSGRLDLQARHRARGAAGAHASHAPYASTLLPCTGRYTVYKEDGRPGRTGVQQLGPVRQLADEPADGDRGLLRHVLLPTRLRLLQAAAERGPPAPGLGREVRLRPADRASTSARRGGRAAADARVAEADVHAEDRPGQLADRPPLEAGRLDPARDRPEGPAA